MDVFSNSVSNTDFSNLVTMGASKVSIFSSLLLLHFFVSNKCNK